MSKPDEQERKSEDRAKSETEVETIVDAEAGTKANADVDTDTETTVREEDPADLEEFPIEWDEPAGNAVPAEERQAITTNEEKVDGKKIVTGDAKYTADFGQLVPDLAHAKVFRSDIAHGHVTEIDTSAAEAIDGVHAVLTPWSEEVPDEPYTSAGQSYPEPTPWDLRVLRKKVRYVGDPIAAVAAKDPETANQAIRQIEVEYEELPANFDPEEAMEPDAPQLFDPDNVENKLHSSDYECNRQSHIEGEIGNIDSAFEEATQRGDMTVVETEWETPYQSHCMIEPHVTLAQRDEDNRFHVITSTQVPNHTRRQLAHLFDIPIRDIRVNKPRIGGGFGGKQAMVIEPIPFALMLAADRPVKYEATRREEFTSLRFRHPMQTKMRTAVHDDGEIEAMDLYALSNTGAYGCHGMTVAGNVGTKALPIYPRVPNARFAADIVYTNMPITGAMRGYGAPQGHLSVEGHMDEVAHELGMDPIEFRSINHVRETDLDEMSGLLGEGEGAKRRIRSCGMEECIERGREAIDWNDLEQPDDPHLHRAAGIALTAQGSGVAGDELGAAHIKMNEDGSFILELGGVDTGTGTDTMASQIASEVLGCAPEDIVVRSSDTDLTPFDYGAYASSTTYISGRAVKETAEEAKERLLYWGEKMLEEPEENLATGDGAVYSEETGKRVTLEDIGYESVYGEDEREHIMGAEHFSTEESPPPFGAQFVDVTVDDRTGEFDINKLVFAADCGVAINPDLAEGQVEGGEHMSLELATGADLEFDEDGRPQVLGFRQYGMPTAVDHPEMETILVETHEPTGPFGAKSIAELPTNVVPPALSNAVRRAVGVRVGDMPITAEKIKRELERTN
jgi:putative selenate reductase molybdopterin-binding subunit